MRLMFVYWQPQNAGSAQDILHYTAAARSLRHEVMLYAPDNPRSPFQCSLDLESADAVIFVFEWNLYLAPGDEKKSPDRPLTGLMGIGHLNIVKLVSRVPRQRRIILDCDGMYNDAIDLGGDFNHPTVEASRQRMELCDSLADKICQPTPKPLRANVRPFLFHGYDPTWEQPLAFDRKEYSMVYVGSNWFRWQQLQRLLQAIEPVRSRVGRIALIGHDWAAMPWWVESPLRERAYFTDPAYLNRLGVEVSPAIPVEHVIPTMSRGVFNPVLIRPLFDYLGLVTCRTFETPAANTIPLFAQDSDYVTNLYGERARELLLGDRPADRIVDVLERPEHYADVVADVRAHLAVKHSYRARLEELIGIIES